MEMQGPLVSLKYKDKVVTLFPPKTFLHLKYRVNRLIGTRIVPSSLIFLYEDLEIDSEFYENSLKNKTFELTVLEKETLITPFFYITTPKIYFFHYPYKTVDSISNRTIPWSAISFWLPNKNPVFIAGNTHFEMDLSDRQIHQKTQMQFPRYYFASAVVKEYIYILGGVSIEGYTNICERYNSDEECWEYIHSHLTAGKSGMTACQWGNSRIFLFGGLDGINYTSNIESFDVESGLWTLLPITLPWETYYLAAAETETGIILLGGKDNRECVHLDIGTLTFKEEAVLPTSVECTKFIHSAKRYGNLLYFLNLDYCVVQFDCFAKKFEVLYDSKKNGVS